MDTGVRLPAAPSAVACWGARVGARGASRVPAAAPVFTGQTWKLPERHAAEPMNGPWSAGSPQPRSEDELGDVPGGPTSGGRSPRTCCGSGGLVRSHGAVLDATDVSVLSPNRELPPGTWQACTHVAAAGPIQAEDL